MRDVTYSTSDIMSFWIAKIDGKNEYIFRHHYDGCTAVRTIKDFDNFCEEVAGYLGRRTQVMLGTFVPHDTQIGTERTRVPAKLLKQLEQGLKERGIFAERAIRDLVLSM